MSDSVVDEVFGEMVYDYGWKKTEKIDLWGRTYEVIVTAPAFSKKPINDVQRDRYKYFKAEREDISKRSLAALKEYLLAVSEQIRGEAYKQITDVMALGVARPRGVIFQMDGSWGILCDFEWDDEHGIGIQVGPELKVGEQDILL
jgi:hypothetical protein